MLYAALALIGCSLQPAAAAFAALGGGVSAAASGRAAVRMAGPDPTGSPLIRAINSLQEAVQQSPAAAFKLGLAKLQAGEYDEPAVQRELASLIAEPCVMFSFTTWPFCIKAKQVLDGYGCRYRVVELNEVPAGYALRAELAKETGRTSVPALYVGGQFVGGCNDGGMGGVMTLDRAAKLKPLLADAGCLA